MHKRHKEYVEIKGLKIVEFVMKETLSLMKARTHVVTATAIVYIILLPFYIGGGAVLNRISGLDPQASNRCNG